MATAFETEMGVMPEISRAIKDMDWILPTDIQSESVPLILGGGDVLMAAETGSGKTGAFCLPVIQIVYETLKDIDEIRNNPARLKNKAIEHVSLSFHDRSPAFAVSQDGLVCQNRENAWNGARATIGVRNRGKYYYEATVNDEGLCRVGWSTEDATYDIGTDSKSYGYGGTGKKSHNRQFDDYGEEFKLHDTIGCLLDLHTNTISYTKNGRDLGIAFNINPQLSNMGLIPAVVLKNAEIKFNFGHSPFKHQPPDGFLSIDNSDPANRFIPNKSGSSTTEIRLKERAPIAIIIEPTRELAEQTFEQIRKFSVFLENPKIHAVLLIGGGDCKIQTANLKYAHIVVATPGRLDSSIVNQELFLSNCRFFILDECDALLSAGYGEMIDQLHSKMPLVTPDGKRLQMIVCSATLHSMDKKLMHFPMWVDLKGQDSVPETVHHVICVVDPNQDILWQKLLGQSYAITTDGVHRNDRLMLNKFTPAVKLLKGEYVVRAIEQQNMDRAIIFCRTKLDCDNLEQKFISMNGGPLAKKGSKFSCVCLHSDRSTQERKTNFERFKNEEVRFLICTDVAARGIDVKGLPYVINVTLPDEKENYVHRIGRVGRAERMGLAISLVSSVKEKVWYHSNCTNRGRGCYDVRLTSEGGCCIWYNEMQYLADIEEHLGVTIDHIDREIQIRADSIDGKVVYGQKLKSTANKYESHVSQLAQSVKELNKLEKKSQQSYLALKHHGLMTA